ARETTDRREPGYITTRCRAGEDAIRSACGRNVLATRGGTISEDFQRVGESRRKFDSLGANAATQLRRAFGRTEFLRALANGRKSHEQDCASSRRSLSAGNRHFRSARRPVPCEIRSFRRGEQTGAGAAARFGNARQPMRRTGGNGFQLPLRQGAQLVRYRLSP